MPPAPWAPTQSPSWRVLADSVCGAAHAREGRAGQDAHGWRAVPDQLLVAAVADGAGCAESGGRGAELACRTAVERTCARLATGETQSSELLRAALGSARAAIADAATECGRPIDEFATTLIVVVASPRAVNVAQIGDGCVVAADRSGGFLGASLPQRGEYANETCFLTSLHAIEEATLETWGGAPQCLAMMSDGLQRLALALPDSRPHRPFFDPLFQFATKADDPGAQEQFAQWLRSPKVSDRTDDDVTLLVASLRCEGEPRV